MKPLALTMGDPAGIGPEITAKAFEELKGEIPFVLLGNAALIERFGVSVASVSSLDEVAGCDRLPVLDVSLPQAVVPGKGDPANAASVITCIERAVSLAQSGKVSGVVTNPISKKVLRDGGDFPWPGHTEFLAHLTGAKRPVMMLAGPALRVVPVTIHIPLADVPGALDAGLLEETIRITAADLTARFGISKPRIAVAGLNPHAGEGGLMGSEDTQVITPVVQMLAGEGMRISGPLPADTMFHARARAEYDVAVCMYHDQALIPVKTLDFEEGVNVTLGLPIVRTSPDHGTAFDIAGQGIADARSLVAAIRLAWDMAAQ